MSQVEEKPVVPVIMKNMNTFRSTCKPTNILVTNASSRYPVLPHPPPVHQPVSRLQLYKKKRRSPAAPCPITVCHQRPSSCGFSWPNHPTSADIRLKARLLADPRPDTISQIHAHRTSTLHSIRTISPVGKGTDSRGTKQGFEPA